MTGVSLQKRLEMEELRVKPGKAGDLVCGFRTCRPRLLQKCANMNVFTLLLALQMLYHLALFSNYHGSIRTIERRFGFSTKETGVMNSAGDFIQTFFVIFVGYFGRKTHKPRYLSISFVLGGLSAVCLSLPYFIYGPLKHADIPSSLSPSNYTDAALSASLHHTPLKILQMCDGSAANMSDVCSLEDAGDGGGGGGPESSTAAFFIFLVAFTLLNLSSSGIFTLGVAYIDENVKRDDSSVYIGFVRSMFAVGPIIGMSLAAVALKSPEDLGHTDMSPTDPQFIGCWWLGGITIGGFMLLTAIPLFFFPKHLPDYYRHHKYQDREKEEKERKRKAARTESNPIISELKDFGRASWKLLSSPTVVLLMLSKVATMYYVIGVIMNIPRYIEIHFHKPAFVANISAAVCGAVATGVGSVLGGYIMKRWKLGPVGASRMYIMSLICCLGGLVIMLLLSCPQSTLHGQISPSQRPVEVSNECNVNCGCSRDRFQPVCSPDGELYFSPCHAGCQDYANGTYGECSCTAGNTSFVSGDLCESECSTFYPYLAVYLVITLAGSISVVPATILMFRIVDEELKAFALGILAALVNMIGFVPGPIMFGALFDSTCSLWQSKCGSRGACLIYEIDPFRHYMHGVSLGFETFSFLLAAAMYYFIVKRFSGQHISEEKDREIEQEAMLAL